MGGVFDGLQSGERALMIRKGKEEALAHFAIRINTGNFDPLSDGRLAVPSNKKQRSPPIKVRGSEYFEIAYSGVGSLFYYWQ